MHVHQSIFEGGKNLMYEKGAPYHLSKFGRSYTAGVLKHARELVAVTNQWVNSYKRLVPGYEAPAYLAWGQKNRSALIRVPMYKPGNEKATRIEVRFPDPAANPYLAFAVLLAAGMAGVNGKYELRAPFEEDVFHLSADERRKRADRGTAGIARRGRQAGREERAGEGLPRRARVRRSSSRTRRSSGIASGSRSRSTRSNATCR